MSESLAGVTFLAFGNGSPDVFSTFAAMSTNSGSLAIGELVGAAGFITAVVAGSMAIVRPFKVAKRSFVRDVGFFVIATSFSMVFLADGHLYTWECITMICFYFFYVVVVVAWHWWLTRRRGRLDREQAARSHFHIPENQELDLQTPEEDEERRNLLNQSTEDFGALERANIPLWLEEEEDDDVRERYMAELSSNMRVRRRTIFERRPTMTPIRPSLVGALEFRSVLSSLQKSRSSHTIPINPLRRYSDVPTPSVEGASSLHGFAPGEEGSYFSTGPPHAGVPARQRAKSAYEVTRPTTDGPRSESFAPRLDIANLATQRAGPRPEQSLRLTLPAPLLSPAIVDTPTALSPVPGDEESGARSPIARSVKGVRLQPPDANHGQRASPRLSPLHTAVVSPGGSVSSTPLSPFPAYRDESPLTSRPPSLYLPEPSISAGYATSQIDGITGSKPLKWWPYEKLPAPQVIAATLFPTLFTWADKTWWDKFLAVVATPSVFLLTITLPVVEPEGDEEIPDVDPGLLSPNPPTRVNSGDSHIPPPTIIVGGERVGGGESSNHGNGGAVSHSANESHSSRARGKSTNTITPIAEEEPPTLSLQIPSPSLQPQSNPSLQSSSTAVPSSKDWQRWLVIVQVITGPLFVAFILLCNTETVKPLTILISLLSCLVFSGLIITTLLYTSTTNTPPTYRPLFCFIGFIVAIFWISTIANEVVGVLKTIGVILNISDSILGLTIFAVGNSLGDLVADITVARLGFPVMALSACFGGPMLNILLGIGVSGLYMTLKAGPESDAPDAHYKPYRIHVGRTLLVSGIALLCTLAGLLVGVPVNGWRMDRRVGWCLVAIWVCSTAINVGLEIGGRGGDVA